MRPPIIQECVVRYECRTLHRNDMAPDTLAQAVEDEFYAQGDFHRVYFGEIVAVYPRMKTPPNGSRLKAEG